MHGPNDKIDDPPSTVDSRYTLFWCTLEHDLISAAQVGLVYTVCDCSLLSCVLPVYSTHYNTAFAHKIENTCPTSLLSCCHGYMKPSSVFYFFFLFFSTKVYN